MILILLSTSAPIVTSAAAKASLAKTALVEAATAEAALVESASWVCTTTAVAATRGTVTFGKESTKSLNEGLTSH